MAAKTVDEYINNLDGWQMEAATRLRSIIKSAAPEAKESFKWAQPVYEVNGPFCYFKAFKTSLNFGFWRGVDIEDQASLLQGSGEKMRHFKLSGIADINEEIFSNYVKQAVHLNLEKGDPTKG